MTTPSLDPAQSSDPAQSFDPAQSSDSPPPTLSEIFITFATISLYGFGGVLAWSRRMMVEERRWLTPEQFNETYALCSMLPGGNIINFSVIFGSRFRGVPGALVALVGLLGPPMVLIIIIGAIYSHYGDLPALRRMLTGIASAAAGLMMATVAKMARPLFVNRRSMAAPLIAIATFAAIGIMQWPLPLVLAVLIPVSVAVAWVRL
jgi:chromate transporter